MIDRTVKYEIYELSLNYDYASGNGRLRLASSSSEAKTLNISNTSIPTRNLSFIPVTLHELAF